MLMSSTYTLRQVAKDLETLITKKRETQARPAVKPKEISSPTAGEISEPNRDA
jgi:hypothetical protein